jgi:hypothetical protein
MGIPGKLLEVIRSRFGDEKPDSEALTQALGELNQRINKNREAVAALEAELPLAVLKSIDAGATERRKLANLDSEYKGLVAAAEATRREIADALARERAVEKRQALEADRARGGVLVEKAEKLQIALATTAKLALQVLQAGDDFDRNRPRRHADPDGPHRDLVAYLRNQIYALTDGKLPIATEMSLSAWEISRRPNLAEEMKIYVYSVLGSAEAKLSAPTPAPDDAGEVQTHA